MAVTKEFNAFQFLLVQLKVLVWRLASLPTYISIPIGTIKSQQWLIM